MSARSNGMSPFRAGILALVVVGLFTYFGFSKANPFANPYEFKAAFNDVNNLKPKSPVRIAGVEVGKVKKVEPIDEGEGEGAAMVTMELEEKALPIRKDAELKIRPRIFLEGNFFVDLEPGSPSADELDEGRDDPGHADGGAGAVGRPAHGPPERHALGPSDVPARVLEGARRGRGGGLQPGHQVLGARLSQLLARQRRDARPGRGPRPPARSEGPAEDLRRARARRARPEGPRDELQRDRRCLRARGCRAGRVDPGAARHAAGGPAGTRFARLCAAVAARVRPRCAAGRALVGRDARGVAAVHHPGAPADVRARAARHGARAAADDPGRRGVQPHLRAVPAREPRALGLHQQRARSVHAPQDPEPGDGQRGRERQPGGALAAPARLPRPFGREPSLGRQQPVLPCRRNAARQSRPAGPAARRRQHADAAPSRCAVRGAGASEPARARRPDSGLPGDRREPRIGDQAARSGSGTAASSSTPIGDFVDNVLPLVAKERAAYQRREARLAKQEGGG